MSCASIVLSLCPRNGYGADALAKWIAERTSVHVCGPCCRWVHCAFCTPFHSCLYPFPSHLSYLLPQPFHSPHPHPITSLMPSQVTIMRPPNYLLLAIWIPAVLVGTLFVYLKRENLHKFRDSRYWAVAAIVWEGYPCGHL